MPTLITTIQHSFGNFSHSNQRRKKLKGIQIGKEEVKLSLFADDMILNTESPTDTTKKLLELINDIEKLQDIKLMHRNPLHFYTLTMKKQNVKSRNNPFQHCNEKNEILWNKTTERNKRPIYRKC